MRKLLRIGAGAILLPICLSTAQQKSESVPRVWSAQAPLYPPLAAQASVQGIVTLRVTTDGKSVVHFDAESGPALLVANTKENVKTWQFQPHIPTSFGIRFDYKLSAPAWPCDRNNPEDRAREYVLLHLPMRVELHAVSPVECDSAEPVNQKN